MKFVKNTLLNDIIFTRYIERKMKLYKNIKKIGRKKCI